jgi:hypothetical protein
MLRFNLLIIIIFNLFFSFFLFSTLKPNLNENVKQTNDVNQVCDILDEILKPKNLVI